MAHHQNRSRDSNGANTHADDSIDDTCLASERMSATIKFHSVRRSTHFFFFFLLFCVVKRRKRISGITSIGSARFDSVGGSTQRVQNLYCNRFEDYMACDDDYTDFSTPTKRIFLCCDGAADEDLMNDVAMRLTYHSR